jgi:hypothetical protein
VKKDAYFNHFKSDMGQKQSAKRKRTVQDRASTTDRNAVKRVGIFGAIRKFPS